MNYKMVLQWLLLERLLSERSNSNIFATELYWSDDFCADFCGSWRKIRHDFIIVTGAVTMGPPIVTYSLNNGTHMEFFVIIGVFQLYQFID